MPLTELETFRQEDAEVSRRAIARAAAGTILPALLVLVLASVAVFGVALPAHRRSLMDARRDQLRQLTATAEALLASYHQRVESGELSEPEAQKRVLQRLGSLRYGPQNKDYFFVSDTEPVLLAHPYRDDLVGTNVGDLQDDRGTYFFRDIVREASSGGEGFVSYNWQYQDDPGKVERKLTHVRLYEPWNWIICTGMYTRDVEAKVSAVTRRATWMFAIALGSMVLLTGLIILRSTRVQAQRLSAIAKLRQREATFRVIFNNAFQFMAMLDTNGQIRTANDAALNAVGLSLENVTGRKFADLGFWPDEDSRRQVRHAVDQARQGELVRIDTSVHDAQGHTIAVDLSIKPVIDDDGHVIGLIAEGRDMTAMKRAEADRQALQERLQQSHKMEAIGQLAGGIAHDFNNLLTGVMGYAELLQLSLPEDSNEARHAGEIRRAANRAADLTRQLLSYSRSGRQRSVPVDLHQIVEETYSLLGRTLDKSIVIRRQLNAARSTVQGDPAQLQSALLNLALNARDAMPDGGTLTIGTANRPAEPAEGWLEVAVTDTGVGMDEPTRRRVFEPFFTTKGPGEGTGLGLASVWGCVRDHGGTVSLETEPGKGTTFRIDLPLSRHDETAPAPPPANDADVPAEGTILVVDDEETVRRFAADSLRRAGYDVIEAADGAQAEDAFNKHRQQITAVLVDLVMPNQDGEETCRKILAIDPDMPIVASSGYSQPGMADRLHKLNVTHFLAKPYRVDELLSTLRQAIEARARTAE